MEKSLVSVIIPTRNRADYLRQALDSVYAQSYQNFEIIVVDDGSSDHTRDIAQGFDKRLHYFLQPSKGAAAARNYGIGKAQGEHVAFLDDDDTFYPDKLETCLSYLSQHPKTAWLCSGFCFVDAAGKPLPRPPVVPPKPDVTLHDIAMLSFISTSTVVAKRECVVAAGGFADTKVSEDMHLWAKILKLHRGAALPQILATFRRHGGNTELPFQAVLEENTRIIDFVLENGKNGLSSRDAYLANLRRIVGESLWAQGRYGDHARFTLQEWMRHAGLGRKRKPL